MGDPIQHYGDSKMVEYTPAAACSPPERGDRSRPESGGVRPELHPGF